MGRGEGKGFSAAYTGAPRAARGFLLSGPALCFMQDRPRNMEPLVSPASPDRRQPEFSTAPRRVEPSFSPTDQAPTSLSSAAPLFESDAPARDDNFQFAGAARVFLDRILDVATLEAAPSPFAMGVLAPAGGGKSSALNWLCAQIAGRGAVVLRLDAAELAQAPEQNLARALYRALATREAALVEAAAAEATQFRADAGALHRAAREKLDRARRQLIAEKQMLATSENLRAGLKEKLLYETPGARVDLFMRRIRAGFAPRLRRFGFAGDPLASLRDLIRDMSDHGGLAGRALAACRGFYAFRGQTRLLVAAALSYAAGLGLDWTGAHQGALLDQLAGLGASGAQAADVLRDRLFWLAPAARGLGWLALALVALNLWRGFSFMQPLVHGAALLDRDLEDHRRDAEQILAVQARHVEQLEAEVETLSRQAAEAERRANAAGASRQPPGFMLDGAPERKTIEALGFVQALAQRLADKRPVVIAVDGYEQLAQPAQALIRQQSLLAQKGFRAIFALDSTLFEQAPAELARRLQLALRLDRVFFAEPLALAPIDAPLSAFENRLIAAVAPLAGPNPRAQKSWRNHYYFLRPAAVAEGPDSLAAALALLLAAEAGALPQDRAILRQALAAPGGEFSPKAAVGGSVALQAAVNEISRLAGPIGVERARRAAALAGQLEI